MDPEEHGQPLHPLHPRRPRQDPTRAPPQEEEDLTFTFLPSLPTSHPIDPSHAAFLISAARLSSFTGRLLSGLLCDRSEDD